jgi:exonuclease SbcD
MTIDQVNAEVERQLTDAIRQQAAHLDPALPAVLTCHVSINDFLVRENPGSEQWMTVGSVPTMLKSELHEASFDYIALGHHHNNMDLKLNTPCWYSGSMQRVDFGEEKQKKGFMTFDLDPRKPRGARLGGSGLPRLAEVPVRRFVTVNVKPKDDDPTPEVCRAIERADVADAIVRVQVEMSKEQSTLFAVGQVRRLLEAAHYVANVRTILPDDRRSLLPAGQQPDAASPMEAIDLYFRAKQFAEKRRETLLAAAKDLVAVVDAEQGLSIA